MTPAGPVLCLVLQDLDSESCGTEVNYIISFAVFAEFNPETRLKFYFHTQPRQRWVLDVVAYSDDSIRVSFHTHLVRRGWLMMRHTATTAFASFIPTSSEVGG